jgi:hypothetical protein
VQLVLVMLPVDELIVVVPAALQFQVGDVKKFAAHWLASTLTDGGSVWFVQQVLPTCSQPFAVLPSQFENPELHVPMAQAPREHVALALA